MIARATESFTGSLDTTGILGVNPEKVKPLLGGRV
jgi:hypothetical protein